MMHAFHIRMPLCPSPFLTPMKEKEKERKGKERKRKEEKRRGRNSGPLFCASNQLPVLVGIWRYLEVMVYCVMPHPLCL